MRFQPIRLFAAVAALMFGLAAMPSQAQHSRNYEVSITNITEAQAFTPFILATHMPSTRMFTPGEEASEELATLAEGGDVGPMADYLSLFPSDVLDVVTTDGLLMPGETVTVEIAGDTLRRRLSFAAMLIPTNDTFVGLNAMVLPNRQNAALVPAYDAGSEPNDELCANIPGPVCGGEGGSPLEDGEGFVFISQGILGIGDLDPSAYDWRNPVAYVQIRRIPSP